MPKKRITQKELAKALNVSTFTISAALRDDPQVKESTRTLIKEKARELGYVTNLSARALHKNIATAIGMIVPALGTATAYNEMINEISELASREDLCLLLGSCNRKIEQEKKYCEMMCQNRVGALIISSCTSDTSHIDKICNGYVPVIYLGGKTPLHAEHYIMQDNYLSGKLAVGHLASLGHRDIGVFLYYPDNNTIQGKLNGYKDAMLERSLEPKIFWRGDSSNTFRSGFDLVQELIAKNELPTGIFCASDLMAYGVLEALKIYGLKVGEDVSVIGHDDLLFSDTPANALTTIALPKRQLANKAMEFAKQLMNYSYLDDESIPKPECKVILPTELIVRKTTGLLRKK